MDYLEKEGNVAYSRVSAAIGVWLGWLAVALDLERGYPDQLSFPRTDSRYLLISHNCLPQNHQKDFQAHQERQSEFLPYGTRDRGCITIAVSGRLQVSPLLIRRHEQAGRRFKDGRSPDFCKFRFRRICSSTTHWCRLERRARTAIHSYFIPEGLHLKDAVLFAYGASLRGYSGLSGRPVM